MTQQQRRINPEGQYYKYGLQPFASTSGNADRKRILENVKGVREGTSGVTARNFGGGGGFGRVALCIPEFDYPFIKAMFPEVTSPDAQTRTKAWQRFAKSPLSEPYRTYKNKRGPQCRSITAR